MYNSNHGASEVNLINFKFERLKMETVKLTKDEIELVISVTSNHCYKNCKSEFKNGEKVRLFQFENISEIVSESFFEILPRFAEVEIEIEIDETQMEEICNSIEQELQKEYEVFSKEEYDEMYAELLYNNNPKNLNWD